MIPARERSGSAELYRVQHSGVYPKIDNSLEQLTSKTKADGKAGELPDFRYSPAIKRSGISWTPQTLDTFIADPQKMVPANRMPYAGMPDADARADLIAYLLKASK